MSTELDRLYARLADRVDAAPPPELSAVRARAAQRRRRSFGGLLAAAAALLAALFAAQAVLAPAATPVRPVLPALPAATEFLPFDGSADPVIRFTGPVRFGMTETAGDRSYAMWMAEDGTEWVGGVDLTTAKPLWPALSLGKFGDTNGMEVSAGAILLLTEQGFDNPLIKDGSDTIIAVDPATGKIMWTLPYSFNDTDRVLYDDTLVITWVQRGVTEALDLRTGKARWTVTDRVAQSGTNALRTMSELYAVGGFAGRAPADRRVVLHLADGRAQLRDVATGRVERELTAPVLPAEGDRLRQETVVDGVLYQFAGGRVSALPLDGSPAGTDVAVQANLDGAWPSPCLAGGLFCAVTGDTGESATLTVIDPRTGATVWQHEVKARVRGVLPAQAGLVVMGEPSVVLAADGTPLASLDGQAMWVESGNLLVVGQAGVSGHQLATGENVALGQPGVTGYCSANATMLTCPTKDGVGVYRYAR
ncbi:outer membrane protein assembly factor BamB family protein [Catellatospora vulcania]|uniref:outer membrane protein assembly factor BamB family protein n=1 Tax=Catellatospora vulcania TaxID=1460450 RepID=UPI0012D48B1B|nr:PQQ-binding-like beta-propeller repeat protein [Catellatospora vulcania]